MSRIKQALLLGLENSARRFLASRFWHRYRWLILLIAGAFLLWLTFAILKGLFWLLGVGLLLFLGFVVVKEVLD